MLRSPRGTRARAPLLPLVLAGCAKQASDPAQQAQQALSELPVGISNNAVAGVGGRLFSFNGLLGAGQRVLSSSQRFELH